MQVTILLDDPLEVTITDVHPVNLPDVCQYAVDIGPTPPTSPNPQQPRHMTHRFGNRTKNTTAGGWGATHQRARRTAAARHHPTDPCARCGQPLGPMNRWLHYDHNHTRTGYLGFSHAHCNTSAGAREANRRQALRRTPRAQSRAW